MRIEALCLGAVVGAAPRIADAVPAGDHGSPLGDAVIAEGQHARTWRWVWTGIYGTLTVGSFALVPLAARRDRPDLVISGVASAVSTALTVLWPLDAEDAGDAVRSLSGSPEARERRTRALAERAADDEESRVSWPWHVGNLVIAAIPAAIIELGYHHHASAALTLLFSFTLGEVQLFTQPTGLRAAIQTDGTSVALALRW